ncbi:Uncharacterised protein [Mycobacteroides abscessus subsp. abscessus]|nr:Uncharacterised protein [Mycobacteroides abscessus subsp. abscessus]
MWPSPPIPTMATRLPGPACQCRSGENSVTPAHSSGAATSRPMPSGMRTTKFSVTTTWVE